MWVSPFRYLRIMAYLQLPEAFRSLSRLSSALSAKASTLRSLLLNHTCKNKSDCIALQSHAKQSFALSRHSSNDCASTSLSSLLAYVVHKELMLFFRCISTSPTFLSASDVLSHYIFSTANHRFAISRHSSNIRASTATFLIVRE